MTLCALPQWEGMCCDCVTIATAQGQGTQRSVPIYNILMFRWLTLTAHPQPRTCQLQLKNHHLTTMLFQFVVAMGAFLPLVLSTPVSTSLCDNLCPGNCLPRPGGGTECCIDVVDKPSSCTCDGCRFIPPQGSFGQAQCCSPITG